MSQQERMLPPGYREQTHTKHHTGTSERPDQRSQLSAKRQDLAHRDSNMLNIDGVTGKLNAEFIKLSGRIDHLTLCLSRSEETCREAESMKARMQSEAIDLQKRNEQLTQQIQSELMLRENVETKVANVHSVCEMLAEHCERVRNTTSGIGMLEATLRKHQENLQSQIQKLEEEYQSLEESFKMEREHLKELVKMERERRIQELQEANFRVKKVELDLNNISACLRAEQDIHTQNLQLLQEREKRFQDLEHKSAQQTNSFQTQICESGSALTAANSEIASLRQELMNQLLTEKDYQNKITALEKEKGEMKDRIDAIDGKTQKMESSIEMLVNEKNTLFMQLKEREYNLLSSHNEKDTLVKQLEDVHKRIQISANDSEAALRRLVDAQKTIEKLEQTNSDVVVKLVAANEALDNMSSEKMKMMDALQKANSSIRDLAQEKESIMRDLCEAKRTVDTVEQEKEEVMFGLREARLTVASLETKENEIMMKLNAAQHLAEVLESDKGEILNKLKGLGDASRNVEDKKKELCMKLHAAETAVNGVMLEKNEICEQLNTAKSMLSRMETEKEQVLCKLHEAESTANCLNEHNDKLTKELDEAKNAIQVLESQVGEFVQQLALSQEHCNTLSQEKDQIVKEMEETHKIVQSLEVEKSEISEKLTYAVESVRALEQDKIELVQNTKTAETKLESLKVEMHQVGEEVKLKEAAFSALQEEKLELMRELETANTGIRMLESEKEELSSKLQETESVNMSTGKKLKGLENKIQAIEKEKSKLTAGLESSKAEVTALKAQMKVAQAAANEKMKEQEENAKSEKMKVVGQLDSAQSALNALKLDHQEVRKRCQSAEEAKQSMSQQLEDLQKQFEESLTWVKVLQNEKNEKMMKAKDIQKAVESYKEAIILQKNYLETEKSRHNKVMAELQMEVTALCQEETMLMSEKKELEHKFIAEKKALKNDCFRLARATQHYRNEVKRLKGELARIAEMSSA